MAISYGDKVELANSRKYGTVYGMDYNTDEIVLRYPDDLIVAKMDIVTDIIPLQPIWYQTQLMRDALWAAKLDRFLSPMPVDVCRQVFDYVGFVSEKEEKPVKLNNVSPDYLRSCAEPLLKLLDTFCDLHCSILVTSDRVELLVSHAGAPVKCKRKVPCRECRSFIETPEVNGAVFYVCTLGGPHLVDSSGCFEGEPATNTHPKTEECRPN